jgi:hypothetical protein
LAATSCAASTAPGPPAWAAPADTVDQPTPCWSEKIAVTASPAQGAAGHRGLTLVFSLAGGADPCTLTGYPGADAPPTVVLSLATQAQAVLEGTAVDADGKPCPSYTDLVVSPPDIVQVFAVPASIDACRLEVHPVTAG